MTIKPQGYYLLLKAQTTESTASGLYIPSKSTGKWTVDVVGNAWDQINEQNKQELLLASLGGEATDFEVEPPFKVGQTVVVGSHAKVTRLDDQYIIVDSKYIVAIEE